MENGMKNEIIDCSEMLTRTFDNIEKSTLEKNNKFYSSWKTVVTKINRIGDKNFGQKLYDHSSIVDIKNETLLVETDHPAWSQMMQFYSKFIINGLKMYSPEMSIKGIVFRTRGSNAVLNSVDYGEEIKKADKKLFERYEKENEVINKYSEKKEKNKEEKEELPEELKAMFDTIRKSMLTKNRNN